jgi:subtilisin family serine protease
MAAKGCATNSCSDSHLLASGQWVVAPTDNNNANPRPAMAPDIVNNSWGGGRGDTWYQATVNSWISAGIFPSFSQGNSGPGCSTANDPGDYPNAYGVGAYDINNNIASFSSRGPSPFAGEIKPNIAAPGVNVRSSVPTNSYANFSGTSMAAPHLSGAVALIWSAAPALNGNINGTRTILDNTAIDVNSLGCGGTLDDNNNFGEGRLDAFAAVTAARGGGGGNPPVTVFTDDFETNRGWTTNAGGTDTATTGQWVRGDPAATNSSGPKQLGTTTSGVNDLVTGAAAGVGAGDFDVDGGITTIRSPAITLPSTGTLTLSLNWYLAHGSNATSADFLRVRVVGSTNTIVLNQAGAAVDRDGAWVAASANISSFAGQSVRLVVEAADAATASLVEAGVDDVRITQQT